MYLMDINKENLNLEKILKSKPRDPFSVNLNIQMHNDDMKLVFHKIKSIYAKGLNIQMGIQSNTLEIKNVNNKHIEIMKQHMLSMGINVKHRIYSKGDKDSIFRNFLHDIQHLNGIEIKVLLDWKENLIESINLSLEVFSTSEDILRAFEKIVLRHYECNHFLKFVKPKRLKDYAIFIKNKNEENIHVVYFDYAQRTDNLNSKIYAYQNYKFQ